MKKVSVCIDMMFSYCDFYERFKEVERSGIHTVEFWKWSDKDIHKIAQAGMNISAFNLDSTKQQLSYDLSRGIINDGRVDDFIEALNESIPIYKMLDAHAMIVLVGENKEYNEQNVIKCLTAAAPILKKHNVMLVVEPLNIIDRKGYSMPYAAPLLETLKKVNSPHIKMLYDIYHQSMMGDFDMEQIKENIKLIGHFHVADAPGRHEPGTATVDYVRVLKEINKLEYDGYIGLEYRSTKKDSETFGFLKEAELIV